MLNITPFKKNDAPMKKGAPKRCINFVLNYSKSYHVVETKDEKIGINLN